MSHLVKLGFEEQEILEQAADILCQLGGAQGRLDGTPWTSYAQEPIHRAEKELMNVIETHGEVR